MSADPPTEAAFQALTDDISEHLYDIGHDISHLDKLQSLLGSKRDSGQLRKQLQTGIDDLEASIATVAQKVAQLTEWVRRTSRIGNEPSSGVTNSFVPYSQLRFAEQKLGKELEGLTAQFHAVQRVCAEKAASILLATPKEPITESITEPQNYSEIPAHASETSPLVMQTQTLYTEPVLQQAEVDFHQAMAEEREAELQEVHQGVQEINAIFKDLGVFVRQQGNLLDTVEDNIGNIATSTQNASAELVKADKNLRKKRKCALTVLIVLVVVVLLVVLILLN